MHPGSGNVPEILPYTVPGNVKEMSKFPGVGNVHTMNKKCELLIIVHRYYMRGVHLKRKLKINILTRLE